MRTGIILLLSITTPLMTTASARGSGKRLSKKSSSSPSARGMTDATGHNSMIFASPLQSLTILDRSTPTPPSPRDKFLPKFQAGLKAEVKARKLLQAKRLASSLAEDGAGTAITSKDASWADKALEQDKKQIEAEERIVERAYDLATAKFNDSAAAAAATSSPSLSVFERWVNKRTKRLNDANKYQFVGIVNPKSKRTEGASAVTWYARKKPIDAKWSVRLIHVNKEAVIKDLFTRGKVDVYGEYVNKGQQQVSGAGGAVIGSKPMIEPRYSVRERSWRTLWNFNPKHFFTDPSGMYWRERRLPPGLYTDGTTVYESSYRYRDGRNGMRRVSPLRAFLQSKSVDEKIKLNLQKKLREGSPDVVIEK